MLKFQDYEEGTVKIKFINEDKDREKKVEILQKIDMLLQYGLKAPINCSIDKPYHELVYAYNFIMKEYEKKQKEDLIRYIDKFFPEMRKWYS